MSSATETEQVRQIALEYLSAGIAVVPLRLDGSKGCLVRWKQYQERPPTADEVSRWFSRAAGIGIITGRVSFGLEVLDFDQPEVFEPWRSLVGGLIERLPTVETASGGFHVLYRCERIAGNTKIAKWEEPDSLTFVATGSRMFCNGVRVKETRIETRGEGGYIVAAGSPVEVHASRNPYCQCLGPPLPSIPTITPDERKRLWEAAATFDCVERASRKVELAKRAIRKAAYEMQAKERPGDGITPWDDFDIRASWDEILSPHGWERDGATAWRRPGKTNGISASVGRNAEGIEVLTVFSSNAGPLTGSGPHSSWGKFRAYKALNHGGDGKAAARAVAGLGYGSREVVFNG